MAQFIEYINASTPLLPHGICLAEQPWIIYGMILAHAGIALAYFAIPAVMYIVEARAIERGVDMTAFKVSGLYRAFIILCGLSHLAAIMTIYVAAYEVYLAVLIATMVVSIVTALAVVRLIDPLVDLIVSLAVAK